MTTASLFDLSGRVALVTGANSGIGKTIAVALAGAGAAVVLVARRAPELEAAKREIEAAGGRAAIRPCDLTDRAALFACAQDAAQPFGAPDILVSAAGVNIRKPMLEVTEADWDATLKLNLDAPFFLAQRLAPAMIAKGWGRIINIASLQSVRAFGNSGAYGASKGGIMQLTRAQAEAWSKHGVTANAIAPGFFATEMNTDLIENREFNDWVCRRTPAARWGRLDEIGPAAVFLASDEASFVNGLILTVDGGLAASM
jgi:gluconate 5-dehydrogenase